MEPIDDHELSFYTDRLAGIGVRLRLFSLLLLVSTVMNAAMVIVARLHLLPLEWCILTSGMATTMSLVAAFYFDSTRRRGEAIHGTLTDELHLGRILEPDPETFNRSYGPVRVRYRLVLREFAASMDVPLVPGRGGPLGYVLANAFLFASLLVWLKV